jgi:DNA-directed RNA polymerase subunit RPC12/RpoP
MNVKCSIKAMSEFKYACPVCGQHIKCDSSQAGTQMECPTCFQKITVPQAPTTDGQKFIITGTKVGERPATNIPADRVVTREKKFPMAAVVILLVLVCAAGAAAFAFRGKIFKHSGGAPADEVASGSDAESTPAKTQTRARPALVAPPANDTNWMLKLDTAVIPDSTAAGRIHGQDFIVERASLQNGTLTLRYGTRGSVALGVLINFGNTQPEALAGQSLNITANAPTAARITLIWQDGGKTARENLDGGYALRLNFGQISGTRLSGKIYFCAPDETKSYVAGTFNADIRKPRPPRPAN